MSSLLSLTVPLQKRLLKFFLKRGLGQFLQNELDLDSLDVQLNNGLVVIRDVVLNAAVCNVLHLGS